MTFWDDLTVGELRKIISENALDHLLIPKAKKQNLIDICNQNLSSCLLHEAISRFSKNKPKAKRLSQRNKREISDNDIVGKSDRIEQTVGELDNHHVASKNESLKFNLNRDGNDLGPKKYPRSSSEIQPNLHKIDNKVSECFRTHSQPKLPSYSIKKEMPEQSEKIVRAGRFSTPSQDFTPRNKNINRKLFISNDSHVDQHLVDIVKKKKGQRIISPNEFTESKFQKELFIDKNKQCLKKHPERFTSKIYWKRVFLAVSLVAVLGYYISIKIVSSTSGVFNHSQYCTSDGKSTPNCKKCPDNAVCNRFTIRCVDHGYKLIKQNNELFCALDKQTYTRAENLLKSLSHDFSQSLGYFICNNIIPSNGILIQLVKEQNISESFIGYTEESIRQILHSYKGYKTDIDIVINELIPKPYYQNAYSIGSTIINSSGFVTSDVNIMESQKKKVYYSTSPKKSFYCKIVSWISCYKWQFFISLSLMAYTIISMWLTLYEYKLLAKIKKIISQNTTLQKTRNSLEYAHGPSPYMIYQLMNPAHLKLTNKKIDFWFSNLSIDRIEQLCVKLVKRDPSICCCFLSSDRKPYYYDKSVFDTLYSNKEFCSRE